MRIAIVGAGFIGVATAHALLDEGHAVDIFDREGFGAGASAGNAGWIAHVDILPLASPKAWRNLPRWLSDPLGPLAIRPAYLPRLAPWLACFVAASRPARVEAGTRAIVALNRLALPAWQRRLDHLGLSGMLRENGILSVWRDPSLSVPLYTIAERQRALGIEVEDLGPAGVRAIEPVFGPAVAGGILYPTGAHVSDPLDLCSALGQAALDRGAHLIVQPVAALAPAGREVAVRTAGGESQTYDALVIAAGAWSKPLAKSLGDRIPLDTERGYNLTFERGALGLSRPVAFEGEGFVTSPLDSGDRIGGGVEFAGLTATPNHDRAAAMLKRVAAYLPDAKLAGGRRWMGFRPSIPDSLPVIGPASRHPNIFYAFGHGHHGLTQAAATAELVAALVAGRSAPIDLSPYSPRRF